MEHVNQHHAADLDQESASVRASAAQSPTQQRRITDARVHGMSKTQRDAPTKYLVRNFGFEDKSPFLFFSDLDFESALKP